MKAEFGENILDQINTYFDLSDGEKEDYLMLFPQVEIALQAQTAYLATDPTLAPYYNSLNTVNRYYSNTMYNQLDAEFGNDISKKVDMYYYLRDYVGEDAAKLYKQQEGLEEYFKRKAVLQQEFNIMIANSASQIPEGELYQFRPDFAPASGIQTDAFNFASGPSQDNQIATETWAKISPAQQSLIQQYYMGEDLPYSVEKRLDSLAREYGMSAQDLLRLLGAEVVQ